MGPASKETLGDGCAVLAGWQSDQDRIELTLQSKQSIKMENFRDVNQNGIKNPASEGRGRPNIKLLL
jgi:hypothetical protein